MSAQIGGGVIGFTDRYASSITDPGGSWDARVNLGTRSYIGGEVAYVGTAMGLNTVGVDSRAALVSNGLEGLLRVNAGTGMWQPYAVAGYTYRHYHVTGSSANTSAVQTDMGIGEVPVGIGLAFRYSGLVADLRGAFHGAVAGNRQLGQGNLSSVGLDARVGFEF